MGAIELNITEVRKYVSILNNIMEEIEREHKAKQDTFKNKLRRE